MQRGTGTGLSDNQGRPSGVQSERSGNRPADSIVVVNLQFDVMRVEMPVGATRHSTKIWNHVDELQLEPRRCAMLARNGLRVGVAEGHSWPAIQALLNAHDAKSSRKQHVVRSGSPLTLDVGEVYDGESVFSYDANGRLQGHTFGPGRKYIHIDYAIAPEDPRRVALKVVPEVHVESLDKHWDQVGGGIQERMRYEGKLFTELTATVDLSPGQFLVIGPSPEANLSFLLGSRFLERETGGARRETLIFATPQLYRSGVSEP
jgi:hypothetical protein